MRAHRILLAVVAVTALVLPLRTAVAAITHDVGIVTSFSDFSTQSFDHFDADPFKGYVNLTVTNTSADSWSDFHFEILDIGWDVSNVLFDVSVPFEPTSSQSGLTWLVGVGPAGGMTLDLFFASDAVLPTETASFVVYTDNTTDQVNFGLVVYPTPEPASGLLILLGLGGLMFLRARR
jgi:hypothetical protein